jgi:signal transduction histidine kinase
MEMTRVAVLELDGSGKIVEWSASAERLFAVDAAHALGCDFWSTFAEQREAGDGWLRDALAGHEQRGEAGFHRPGGDRFVASVVVIGRGGRAMVVLGDLTEERHLEEKLQERDRLFALLAHDLRQPLSVINTVAGLIEIGDVPELARRIRENVARLDELTAQLLDLGSVRFGGTLALERSAVDLGDLVRSAAGLLAPADRDRILMVASDERPIGQWDRRLLRRIVQNLVDNALAHSPAGTPIAVAWHHQGAQAVLTVENHCPEIDAAKLSSLFEPFRRMSTRGRVGLGLYIARDLARAHGGELTASWHEGWIELQLVLPKDPPGSWTQPRRHFRTPFHTTLEIGVGDRKLPALGRDISLRGLAFWSQAEVRVDEWIKVEVHYQNGSFSVLGVVRHATRHGERSLVGVEFPTELEQADIDLIRNPPRSN